MEKGHTSFVPGLKGDTTTRLFSGECWKGLRLVQSWRHKVVGLDGVAREFAAASLAWAVRKVLVQGSYRPGFFYS